jgi:hypothetical protein
MIFSAIEPGKITKKMSSQEGKALWLKETLPLSPKQVLLKYSQFLTDYEKIEIKKYHDIFYIGIGSNKQKPIMAKTKDG